MSSRTDIDSAKMSFLEATTSVSVATLVRINKINRTREGFAIGAVVYTDKTNTVVLTNASAYNEDKDYVSLVLGDNKLLKAEKIATNGNSVLRCLLFRNASNFKAITFSEATVERGQETFTRAKAWPDIPPSLYPGSVIHPKCSSIENFVRGPVSVVDRYDNHFALSCPVSGPMPELGLSSNLQSIAGAPVFNVRGEAVGLIELCNEGSHDIKYARNSTSVINQLQALFDEEDWLSALTRELVKRTST